MGANGADKSTLARIISGLVQPDAGSMMLERSSYRPAGKAAAESLGVQIVQQELSLIPTLSVAQNLFLNGARRVRRPRLSAREPRPGGQEQPGLSHLQESRRVTSAYQELIARLRSLAVQGLSTAVYTQTTDCAVEVNGLLAYDRAVIKMPVEAIALAQKTLYLPMPTIKGLVPTAETSPQTWKGQRGGRGKGDIRITRRRIGSLGSFP